jgi:hypothetical protein
MPGSFARIASMYHSTRARRLPDGSLVSLRGIVRCVPGGSPTARSYHFGESFNACPAAARWLSLVSLRCIVRRVPGGCPTARWYHFGESFNVSPVAVRWLDSSVACPATCLTAHLPVRVDGVPGVLTGIVPGGGRQLAQWSGSVTASRLT